MEAHIRRRLLRRHSHSSGGTRRGGCGRGDKGGCRRRGWCGVKRLSRMGRLGMERPVLVPSDRIEGAWHSQPAHVGKRQRLEPLPVRCLWGASKRTSPLPSTRVEDRPAAGALRRHGPSAGFECGAAALAAAKPRLNVATWEGASADEVVKRQAISSGRAAAARRKPGRRLSVAGSHPAVWTAGAVPAGRLRSGGRARAQS